MSTNTTDQYLPGKAGVDANGNAYTTSSYVNPNYNGNITAQTLQGSPGSVVLPNQPTLTPVPAPQVQTPTDSSGDIMKWYVEQSNANKQSSTQYQDMYSADQQNAGLGPNGTLQTNANTANSAVTQEQANLSAIQAQLNAVSSVGTQAQLQNESNASGKDITTQFLSRQSQEIARQAGIQALPLQAQALASQAKIQSLQGNAQAAQTLLTQAQEHVDKLFSIQSQDAQNEYTYKQKLLDTVYDYATKQEQKKLDEQKTKNDQDFQLKRDKINNDYQTQQTLLANSLKNNGGNSTIPVVTGDPTTDRAIFEQNSKQDAASTQTVNDNFQSIQALLPKGKTIDTLTTDDISKMSNADQVTIGKALARMQNPDVSRMGQDTGNSFEEQGWGAQLLHGISQLIPKTIGGNFGRLYDPSKVLEGLKTAQSLYNQRNGGGSSGNNIVTHDDGTVWRQNADGSYTRIK